MSNRLEEDIEGDKTCPWYRLPMRVRNSTFLMPILKRVWAFATFLDGHNFSMNKTVALIDHLIPFEIKTSPFNTSLAPTAFTTSSSGTVHETTKGNREFILRIFCALTRYKCNWHLISFETCRSQPYLMRLTLTYWFLLSYVGSSYYASHLTTQLGIFERSFTSHRYKGFHSTSLSLSFILSTTIA